MSLKPHPGMAQVLSGQRAWGSAIQSEGEGRAQFSTGWSEWASRRKETVEQRLEGGYGGDVLPSEETCVPGRAKRQYKSPALRACLVCTRKGRETVQGQGHRENQGPTRVHR